MPLPPFELAHEPAHPAVDAGLGWTVVVGHDGSAAAAPVLAHAARQAGPEGYLIVVHALPVGVSPTETGPGSGYASAVRTMLSRIEAALPEGISHESRVVAGPASTALLEAADRCGADEIVLGAARGHTERNALGRVSDAVLRRSDLPVTIVPYRGRYGRDASATTRSGPSGGDSPAAR